MVKAWEFPVSKLYAADCIEKKGYALMIDTFFHKFTNIINDLIYGTE